jgi:hypothetical protein
MLDFFCPWCGDFTFDTITCPRCDGAAGRELAQTARKTLLLCRFHNTHRLRATDCQDG